MGLRRKSSTLFDNLEYSIHSLIELLVAFGGKKVLTRLPESGLS